MAECICASGREVPHRNCPIHSASVATTPRWASEPYPRGVTAQGRYVILCYCGGGDLHEWRPDGGGARILSCFVEAPIRKPEAEPNG